jgi:hypothetical protein
LMEVMVFRKLGPPTLEVHLARSIDHTSTS